MRALKIATIVMGVMLVVGVAVLAAVIAQRLSARSSPQAPVSVTLNEPPGTRIMGIAATQDRIVLELQGGGPDRVLLLDPHTGAQIGAIALRP
ncbi:MAG: cadherin repeat domain-containing protein [Alphaproteobacteria bacterium]|nr:cadherin repeat domain-containing protein [Alphaproteobacteria bacterium]